MANWVRLMGVTAAGGPVGDLTLRAGRVPLPTNAGRLLDGIGTRIGTLDMADFSAAKAMVPSGCLVGTPGDGDGFGPGAGPVSPGTVGPGDIPTTNGDDTEPPPPPPPPPDPCAGKERDERPGTCPGSADWKCVCLQREWVCDCVCGEKLADPRPANCQPPAIWECMCKDGQWNCVCCPG